MTNNANDNGEESEVKDKVLYLRIDPDLHNAISLLAKRDRRSLTSQAEYALDKYATEELGDYHQSRTQDAAKPTAKKRITRVH